MSLAGKVLQNRYAVENQIGEGGMGTVYLATDRRFGTKVAIKQTLFTDSALLRAFEREAQLLNGLRHPALPRVSDHFAEDNGAFIVMEYIAGEDLSVMVERSGAFAPPDVLRWAEVLLDALDYLHTQKMPVVHRDIKPQNLKLTPRGEIVLLDFGLAKGSVSELTQASVAKSVFGYSRAYAPLEQIQGAGTDPRSDLYSLAATIYHLLTGKPPIDALTRATAVLNAESDPLQPAHIINPKVSVAVSGVLHQAMALNSNLRPSSAAKMRFALSEAEQDFAAQEFYDGATVVQADKIFTQNTELIKAGATARAESEAATKIVAPNVTELQSSLRTVKHNDENAAAAKNFGVVEKFRSWRGSPVKTAATIIIFGSLGFVAWYGIKPTFLPATAPAQTLDFDAQTEFESDSQNPAPPADNSTISNSSAPTPGNSVPAQTQTAENQTANETNSPKTIERAAKPNHPKSNPPKSPGGANAAEADDMSDLENLDEEIDVRVNQAQKKANLEKVPPEIRSNDPNNPVDREKLRIFVKRKTEEARKQREAARKQVQEVNRERAEQNLPPLRPAPPKPKRPLPKNPDN